MDDLVLERRTRDYYLPTQEAGHVSESHNLHMLYDDISSGLLPAGLGRPGGPNIRLEPYDKNVDHLVATALSRQTFYHSRTLDDSVGEWLRSCGRQIASGGRAVFEIGYLVRRSDGRAEGFRFHRLHPEDIAKQGNQFVQQVPRDARSFNFSVEEGYASITESVLVVPAERILIFEMPVEYRSVWPGIRRNLAFIDQNEPSALAMQHMSASRRETFPFDFDQFRAAYDRAVAEATRAIGWNAREVVPLERGYSWMLRRLRFRRFLITLRDSIVATLNEGLRRTGRRIGFTGQLVLQGMPGLTDVDRAERLLREGRSFTEITAPFDSA